MLEAPVLWHQATVAAILILHLQPQQERLRQRLLQMLDSSRMRQQAVAEALEVLEDWAMPQVEQ